MMLRCILRTRTPLKQSRSSSVDFDKVCMTLALPGCSGESFHHVKQYATQFIPGGQQLLRRSLEMGSPPVGKPSVCRAPALIFSRGISIGRWLSEESKSKDGAAVAEDEEAPTEDSTEAEAKPEMSDRDRDQDKRKIIPKLRHMNRDRSQKIPVETSIRYLKSAAYKEAYGDSPVWLPYRRNFPGQFAPKRTRKTCIRNDEITTGNPCPICRDEYLVVHYQNVELLQQFISPHNGEVLNWEKTGVCRRQHERLLIEIDRAKDYGTITYDVPFREYNYEEYKDIYDSYNKT